MSTNIPQGGSLPGPWIDAFWFEVPFPFMSKSNFRRFNKKSDSARWRQLQSFEDSLVPLARLHLPDTWDKGSSKAPVDKRPQVVSFIFAATVLDSSNLSKSSLDALESVVFHTDASVRYCAGLTHRTRTDQFGAMAFARLDVAATFKQVLNVANSLAVSCMDQVVLLDSFKNLTV